MAYIEESSRGGRILLYQGFRSGSVWKRMIPYIGVFGKCHTPIRTNVFKNVDAIRVYGVGKHNHPGDRPDVHDDSRNSDDDADDEVLGSCSDTFTKWSTECPNGMLDDEMQYEKSKDSLADVCDDYERETNIERKIIDV